MQKVKFLCKRRIRTRIRLATRCRRSQRFIFTTWAALFLPHGTALSIACYRWFFQFHYITYNVHTDTYTSILLTHTQVFMYILTHTQVFYWHIHKYLTYTYNYMVPCMIFLVQAGTTGAQLGLNLGPPRLGSQCQSFWAAVPFL